MSDTVTARPGVFATSKNCHGVVPFLSTKSCGSSTQVVELLSLTCTGCAGALQAA